VTPTHVETSATTAALATTALRLVTLRKPLTFGPRGPRPPAGTGGGAFKRRPFAARPTAAAAPAAAPPAAAPSAAVAGGASADADGVGDGVGSELWGGTSMGLVTPAAVAAAAAALDVGLSAREDELFMLPLVVEMCRAPLPAGWREAWVDGAVAYVAEGGDGVPQAAHPLTAHFAEAVKAERRRLRRMRHESTAEMPAWMEAAADAWVQFVDGDGALYYHNFTTGERAPSLAAVLRAADPCRPGLDAPQPGRPPPPPMPPSRSSQSSSRHGGSRLSSSRAGGSRQGGSRQGGSRQGGSRGLLSKLLAGLEAEAPQMTDDELKLAYNERLQHTYRHVLGAAVASSPRSVRLTLDVASAYGLDLVGEIDYLWLADLALSLPVPAGWVHVDHPVEKKPYWHNAITGASLWQNPVDEFIKTVIKIQRAPYHHQVRVMAASSIARNEPGFLGGGKFMPRPAPSVVGNMIEAARAGSRGGSRGSAR
jgi:uncharacterized membrane protein YgcG